MAHTKKRKKQDQTYFDDARKKINILEGKAKSNTYIKRQAKAWFKQRNLSFEVEVEIIGFDNSISKLVKTDSNYWHPHLYFSVGWDHYKNRTHVTEFFEMHVIQRDSWRRHYLNHKGKRSIRCPTCKQKISKEVVFLARMGMMK